MKIKWPWISRKKVRANALAINGLQQAAMKAELSFAALQVTMQTVLLRMELGMLALTSVN